MTIRRTNGAPLASSDVGKFCVLESPMTYGICTRPWEITGASNKRVYVKQDQEFMSGGVYATEEKYVLCTTVLYVCDTKEEAKMLHGLSENQFRELNDTINAIRKKYRDYIDNLFDTNQQTG